MMGSRVCVHAEALDEQHLRAALLVPLFGKGLWGLSLQQAQPGQPHCCQEAEGEEGSPPNMDLICPCGGPSQQVVAGGLQWGALFAPSFPPAAANVTNWCGGEGSAGERGQSGSLLGGMWEHPPWSVRAGWKHPTSK